MYFLSGLTISPINPVSTQSGFLKYSFALNLKISLTAVDIPSLLTIQAKKNNFLISICSSTDVRLLMLCKLETSDLIRKIENFPNKPSLASLEFLNIRRC